VRKSIILAVVVVVALVVAGTGGVFATWSDSETSEFNWIETGSLDLKVNGADDIGRYWGDGVPRKVFIDHMIPCTWYGPFEVELWNAGQCTEVPKAYIHFKEFDCLNVPPKDNPYNPDDPDSPGSACWYENYGPDATTGYPDPFSGDLKPEPELVAEYGGKVDCTWVEGIGGPIGDNCSMGAAVQVVVTDETGLVIVGPRVIDDLYCDEIELFDLPPCEARTIYLWFKLYQFSEEDFGFIGDNEYFVHPDDMDPVPTGEAYEAALMHWKKFNDWPSWAYMKDAVWFNIEFDLYLEHVETIPGDTVI
jgi:predicted ribosomally synthesized peptide with SipW-like signal peptide